jgi:DNA-binding NarL/FixJ family response regulator
VRVVTSGDRSHNPFIVESVRPAQIAVVDDHLLIGRLVVGLLERAGYTASLAFGATDDETWAAVQQVAPELLLLDFDLGQQHSALEILRRAVDRGISVAGFTGSDDELEHAAYLEAGAGAVVSKSSGPAELVAMVELALGGHELMAPADRHTALARLRTHRAARNRVLARFATLTAREAETLRMITEGCGAADIAAEWNVALPTVRSHIRAVLSKLGVSSQLQAAAASRDSGWYGTITATASSILTMPRGTETGTIARRSGSTG